MKQYKLYKIIQREKNIEKYEQIKQANVFFGILEGDERMGEQKKYLKQ